MKTVKFYRLGLQRSRCKQRRQQRSPLGYEELTRAFVKNGILMVCHENLYHELSYRCTRDWPKIPEDVHKEIQASEDCERLPTLAEYFTQISEGYPTSDSINSLIPTLQKKRL